MGGNLKGAWLWLGFKQGAMFFNLIAAKGNMFGNVKGNFEPFNYLLPARALGFRLRGRFLGSSSSGESLRERGVRM